MKSPRVMFPALMLIALVAVGVPAGAQTRDEVQIAIERTDDLLLRAQEIVSASDNQQAIDELAFAVRIQGDAKSQFSTGRYVLALDLTRRARLHADRAIALVKGLPDPDRVLPAGWVYPLLLKTVPPQVPTPGLGTGRGNAPAAPPRD